MSVATEFPPTVYIPERARPATRRVNCVPMPAVAPLPAVRRHLALVPVPDRPATQAVPGTSIRRLPGTPGSQDRAMGRRFGDSAVAWPLTIAPPAPVRLTRRGVAALLLVTVAVGLLLLVVARASGPGASGTASVGSSPAAGSVMVEPGDTLWSIAQRIAPQRDPRLEVDKLQHLNHLRSVALTPGQTLKLG